jgi:type III pantothenate kinase
VTVLLIDVGNTRIKWAVWRDGRLGRQQAVAHAEWTPETFKGLRRIERVLGVSVANDTTNQSIIAASQRALDLNPEFLVSARSAGGVTTRYFEPWRLGADRFAAVIGAFYIAKKRPACVIDVGTAMTIDLVDGEGLHRGGAIVPGPELMVKSLLKNTNGIEQRAAGGSAGRTLFARETRAAIEQGASYAVAAVVDRAVEESRRTLRRTPQVYLTGGAANRIHPLLQTRHVSIPDLVLRGVAVSFGLRVQ